MALFSMVDTGVLVNRQVETRMSTEVLIADVVPTDSART